MKIFVDHI